MHDSLLAFKIDSCRTFVLGKQRLYLLHVGAIAWHGSQPRGVVVVDGGLQCPIGSL